MRLYDSNSLSLWGISDRRLRSILPSKFSGICCPLFFLAFWVGGLENYLFFSIFIYIDVFRICQLSMMERLAKINHSFQSLIIFSKRSPSNIWQWPKYVSFVYFQPFNDFLMYVWSFVNFLWYSFLDLGWKTVKQNCHCCSCKQVHSFRDLSNI